MEKEMVIDPDTGELRDIEEARGFRWDGDGKMEPIFELTQEDKDAIYGVGKKVTSLTIGHSRSRR